MRTAQLTRHGIECYFPYDQALVDKIRLVPDRKWDKQSKRWTLKNSLKALEFIIENNFALSQADLQKIDAITERLILKEKQKKIKILLSKATEAPVIPDVANLMSLPAYAYQWVPSHYIRLCDGRFLLADDMACGKSVESLMMANLPEYRKQPVLIVTPVPLNFQKEIMKFFGEPSIVVTSKEQLYYLNPRVRYYIVKESRLKWLFDNVEKKIPKLYVKDLFVIIDEAHMYKNPGALRTKFMRAISWAAPHVVAMTGTPVMNYTRELYELLILLDPNFMSWTKFTKLFCNPQHNGYGWNNNGGSNLQYLNSWLFENIMVRREKSQVLSQLPPKVRQSFELSEVPIRVHADSIFELFAKSAEAKAKDPSFRMWLEAIMEEVPKLGFFGYHKVMLDLVQDICRSRGWDFVRIDGNQTQEERQACVDRFADDPNCRVADISIVCGGTGLNRLQIAQVFVMGEFYWRPGDILQAEDRFHRPGVKGSVLGLYPMVTEFDYKLGALLLEKLATVRRITSVEGVPDAIDDTSLLNSLSREFSLPIRGKAK